MNIISLTSDFLPITWLRDMFNKAAGDSLGQLDEFEVMQLMKKLNNGVASTRIRHKFRVSEKSLYFVTP